MAILNLEKYKLKIIAESNKIIKNEATVSLSLWNPSNLILTFMINNPLTKKNCREKIGMQFCTRIVDLDEDVCHFAWITIDNFHSQQSRQLTVVLHRFLVQVEVVDENCSTSYSTSRCRCCNRANRWSRRDVESCWQSFIGTYVSDIRRYLVPIHHFKLGNYPAGALRVALLWSFSISKVCYLSWRVFGPPCGLYFMASTVFWCKFTYNKWFFV